MRSDSDVEHDVRDEIDSDLGLDASDIAISVKSG